MANLIKIDIADRNPSLIKEIGRIIKRGGVLALSTDTFYGLGADPFNPTAIEKIYRIKGRDPGKPILILIEDLVRLSSLVQEVTEEAEILIRRFWPGPITIIFKGSHSLPSILTGRSGKIGIRLPASNFLIWLLKGLDMPITATSANPSGLPSPRTAEEVEEYFGGELDLIVDAGKTKGTKGSTVIDSTTKPIRLIRKGMIETDKIEEVVGPINKEDNN